MKTLAARTTAIIFAVFATLYTPAAAFAADGSGYGGDSEGLTMKWEKTSEETTTKQSGIFTFNNVNNPAEEISPSTPTPYTLNVYGYGFRNHSNVTLNIGENDEVTVRADDTGTLNMAFEDVETLTTTPGRTIIAEGRSPSGSTRVLVGSIPPLPNGQNPTIVALQIVAGIISLVILTNFIKNRKLTPHPHDPQQTETAIQTQPLPVVNLTSPATPSAVPSPSATPSAVPSL